MGVSNLLVFLAINDNFFIVFLRSLFLSLLGYLGIRSIGSKGTLGSHSNVRVGILSLGAGCSIHAISWPVCVEISVHIPTELLGSSLRVAELLLGLALEGIKLCVEHLKFLFGINGVVFEGSALAWIHLRWLLGDSDYYSKVEIR